MPQFELLCYFEDFVIYSLVCPAVTTVITKYITAFVFVKLPFTEFTQLYAVMRNKIKSFKLRLIERTGNKKVKKEPFQLSSIRKH